MVHPCEVDADLFLGLDIKEGQGSTLDLGLKEGGVGGGRLRDQYSCACSLVHKTSLNRDRDFYKEYFYEWIAN